MLHSIYFLRFSYCLYPFPIYLIFPDWLFPKLFIPQILEISGMVPYTFVVFLLVVVAIGTYSVIAEELFFRGFLQGTIEEMSSANEGKKLLGIQKKYWLSIILVSFLFGFTHLNLLWTGLLNWGTIPPNIPFIILNIGIISGVGILFAILRVKCNSIYPPIIAHAAANIIEAFLLVYFFS